MRRSAFAIRFEFGELDGDHVAINHWATSWQGSARTRHACEQTKVDRFQETSTLVLATVPLRPPCRDPTSALRFRGRASQRPMRAAPHPVAPTRDGCFRAEQRSCPNLIVCKSPGATGSTVYIVSFPADRPFRALSPMASPCGQPSVLRCLQLSREPGDEGHGLCFSRHLLFSIYKNKEPRAPNAKTHEEGCAIGNSFVS